MSKFITEKNLLLLLSLFLVVFIFLNQSHIQNKRFIIKGNVYYKLDNFEFKNNINQELTSDQNHEKIIYGECNVTGNMHDRHKVRWVKSLLLKNIFQISSKINSQSPYYVNIILHSLLIFLSIIFLDRAFILKKKYIIFFLFYISFIFQHYLGEYSYSIFEMFFVSAALYASKKRNIYLFFSIVLMATLNRESGFIILLIWLIFNKNLKVLLFASFSIIFIFLFLNFKTINCIINPKFFIPLESQKGQINFSDLNTINLFSTTKLFMVNFIIPFWNIFYKLIKNKIKNIYFTIITVIYLLVFLLATPLHHLAVKLVILPLIILSFYLTKENKVT